tara:strand:- start:5129 stop:5635 length:507 start_codon:yes stop_codon:yes gene_type:complete
MMNIKEKVDMPELNPAEFRHAASRFTTGVTVITSLARNKEIIGMTANSFMTVSLSPPTVLVSVMNGRTLNAIEHSGKFAINVLPAAAKDISNHFAGRPVPGLTPDFAKSRGMPKLKEAIAYFDCRIEKFIQVADHTLLVAKVNDCCYKDVEDPLIFFSSQYHSLNAEI